MKRNTTPQTVSQKNPKLIFAIKSSTLCSNKEFFSAQKPIAKIISETEYKDAMVYIENMDTVYFEMSNAEKNIYNRSIEIIKSYYLQSK